MEFTKCIHVNIERCAPICDKQYRAWFRYRRDKLKCNSNKLKYTKKVQQQQIEVIGKGFESLLQCISAKESTGQSGCGAATSQNSSLGNGDMVSVQYLDNIIPYQSDVLTK